MAAAVWTVGSQTDWDPTAHTAAATAFIALLHAKYFLPFKLEDKNIFLKKGQNCRHCLAINNSNASRHATELYTKTGR